jgi:F-type H+-transporting ATPase subunit alpha
MKSVAGQLRLDLAQYRELAAFAQFGSDLDRATLARLTRGERTTEILKQGQYQPMSMEEQVVSIYSAVNGYLDELPKDKVLEFETDFLKFMRSAYADVLNNIKSTGKMDDATEEKLQKAITEFKSTFAV